MPADALLKYKKEQKVGALRVFLLKFSRQIKLIDGVSKLRTPTPVELKKKELYTAQVLVLFKSLASEMSYKDLESLCPAGVNPNYFFDNHNLRTSSLSDSITIADIQEEQINYEDHWPIIVEVNNQLIEMLPKEKKDKATKVSSPGVSAGGLRNTQVSSLSKERTDLIAILNKKGSSWRDSAATEDLITKARYYLIGELKNPNSKISVMRTQEFHSHHGSSTIEQILVSSDSKLKNLLDVTQEKEEGKLIGNERNSLETGSPSPKSILSGLPENFSGTILPGAAPAKENKNVVLLDPRERQNKITFIIMHVKRMHSATDLFELRSVIDQIKKLKTELARHDQPLTEDDIKNYDQGSELVIVGDRAAIYWQACETIDQKYSEVEKALKGATFAEAIAKETQRNNLVCSKLETEIENVILNIGENQSDGNATPDLQPLHQLLIILQNKVLEPAEKLHQCVTKIYGNDIKIENLAIKNQFIATIGSILNENPEAAVAVLTKEFKNYQQYLSGDDSENTYKWDETKIIIEILESDKPANKKLTEVNTRIIEKGKNTLSAARNPFAVFINIWAWVKRQFNSSASESNITARWDVASSQSKGAGVVRVAEGVLPKPLKNQ